MFALDLSDTRDKSMRKITFITLVALVPLACSSSPPMAHQGKYGHGPRTLVVATGSPGELGLLRPLAEEFARQSDVTVLWHKAGSGRSLELLRSKQVDAIMVHAPAFSTRCRSDRTSTRTGSCGSARRAARVR